MEINMYQGSETDHLLIAWKLCFPTHDNTTSNPSERKAHNNDKPVIHQFNWLSKWRILA